MKETEKQEEDLVGEHEKEDEGRAQTALVELQGGGGKHMALFFREACRRSPESSTLSCFRVNSMKY